MDSLFSPDIDVVIGDIWVNLGLERAGVPDPMMRTRVAEVDSTGMVKLVSCGFPEIHRFVSSGSLRREYRREV